MAFASETAGAAPASAWPVDLEICEESLWAPRSCQLNYREHPLATTELSFSSRCCRTSAPELEDEIHLLLEETTDTTLVTAPEAEGRPAPDGDLEPSQQQASKPDSRGRRRGLAGVERPNICVNLPGGGSGHYGTN